MTTLRDYSNRRSSTPAAPAPVQDSPATAAGDAVYMQAWGLTPAQWAALSDVARVWHRWNVNKAPGFTYIAAARG